jgi:hypothetical protein
VVETREHINRVCIILSPDIVPQLIAGLTKGVEMYQAQFGLLRKPPPKPPEQLQKPDPKQ